MTMVITLKHPVLGYCLCLDAYFTGDCKCQLEQAAKPTDQPTTAEASSSKCTSCCGTEAADHKKTTTEKQKPTEPCDDCVKQLIVDVGDYVWHGSDQLPVASEFTIPPFSYSIIELSSPSNLAFYSPVSIRGDPPPGLHDSDIPHYLSHSVMRL